MVLLTNNPSSLPPSKEQNWIHIEQPAYWTLVKHASKWPSWNENLTHGFNADPTTFLCHRSGSNYFGSKLACPSQTCATFMHFLIFGRGPSSIFFFPAAMETALSSQTISPLKLNSGLDFCAICVAHAMSVVVCVEFPWLYFAFMFNFFCKEVLAFWERERESKLKLSY